MSWLGECCIWYVGKGMVADVLGNQTHCTTLCFVSLYVYEMKSGELSFFFQEKYVLAVFLAF